MVAVTPQDSTALIPRGAGVSGKVINKILPPGTQRSVIPAAELQALPAGKCLVNIVITSAKRILPQQFLLAANSSNEFMINLR